jgi:hypothetical protein
MLRRMDVTRLVDRYCEAWTLPDSTLRAAALADVWADAGRYTDPTVTLEGAGALLTHIASLHAKRPGAVVRRLGVVDMHHDVARFAWHVVLPDGRVLQSGVDVVLFDAAGRLERVIGFFDATA